MLRHTPLLKHDRSRHLDLVAKLERYHRALVALAIHAYPDAYDTYTEFKRLPSRSNRFEGHPPRSPNADEATERLVMSLIACPASYKARQGELLTRQDRQAAAANFPRVWAKLASPIVAPMTVFKEFPLKKREWFGRRDPKVQFITLTHEVFQIADHPTANDIWKSMAALRRRFAVIPDVIAKHVGAGSFATWDIGPRRFGHERECVVLHVHLVVEPYLRKGTRYDFKRVPQMLQQAWDATATGRQSKRVVAKEIQHWPSDVVNTILYSIGLPKVSGGERNSKMILHVTPSRGSNTRFSKKGTPRTAASRDQLRLLLAFYAYPHPGLPRWLGVWHGNTWKTTSIDTNPGRLVNNPRAADIWFSDVRAFSRR